MTDSRDSQQLELHEAETANVEVTERLRETLQKYWGYDQFRPLQLEAMTAALTGRDAVVVLPTGGGKSLCYQAPALCMPGLAVVVSPLISLMKDQVDALRSLGVPAAYANSSLTLDERRAVEEDVRQGRIKLLYLAPERLLTEYTLRLLQEIQVSLIAVDEAHCVSMWGHDFRPEYRQLSRLQGLFPQLSIQALTATASPQVREDIAGQLQLRQPEMLVGSFDRPNLVYRVQRRSDLFRQVTEVIGRYQGESGIIYCISKREVNELCRKLVEHGVRARPYHADLTGEERQRFQEDFIKDRIEVIVATVAFGMGIDKPDVRFVIHAGMPKSIEHYQQESGRAGRDGLEAECCLFYSGQDFFVWKRILEGPEADNLDQSLASLNRMTQYCQSVICRHRTLVAHFGQQLLGDSCGACDVCRGDLQEVEDPTTIGQKILSCVLRLRQQYGGDYTAKVLIGSKEQRIVEKGHDQLSTHGLLSHVQKGAVRDWIEQLVEQGFLVKRGEYHMLEVTDQGHRLLKREVTPRLLQAASTTKSKRTGRAPADDSWQGVDRGLFEELRRLRRDVASRLGVPAYMVFGDATLRDVARRQPASLEDFRQCHGVGDKKLADFGDQFLAEVVSYDPPGD